MAGEKNREFANRRVTVVGLGRFGGGVGAAKWLCEQGAKVTVSDAADPATLTESIAALDGYDVEFHLGEHLEADFLDTDLLVVNPAMPKTHPLLQRSAKAGVSRTTEINLFMERCAAPIVGITGSVGKSTTTAMAGAILSRKLTTHIGGNIGKSLLPDLPQIRSDHVVVLELSSFQLEDTPGIKAAPHIALVTNLLPNHLDRYNGDIFAYADAKKNIFRFQGPAGTLILNHQCTTSSAWADEAPGKVEFFDPTDHAHFELVIPGRHNQANAQAAWAIAKCFNISRYEAAQGLLSFHGLEHRLQFVAKRNGVRYYNDSKCTTPDGAIVGLEAFETGRTILLLGGYDKGMSFDELASKATAHAKNAIAYGAAKDAIADSFARISPPPEADFFAVTDDLSAAMKLAETHAEPGDVILLSPACASYDQFSNYEQRGEFFAQRAKLTGDQ
ncbi:MAG: UDP-N-acetylmuramoyl-L-alanine--D-glutamate ligase [Phycisphaerae bacterium]|nr:UDP-N-acetylmuramoyl-L-alanine--D-glutamate ligase [Phycisphaerae bacterium]